MRPFRPEFVVLRPWGPMTGRVVVNKLRVVRSVPVVMGLAAVGAVMLVSAGSAATTTKPFTANLCDPLPATSLCPEPTTQPPALSGGTDSVYLTIHNTANPQTLGSANIGLPTGGPSPVSYGPASLVLGPTTTVVGGDGTAITLRNLNLPSGGYVTL